MRKALIGLMAIAMVATADEKANKQLEEELALPPLGVATSLLAPAPIKFALRKTELDGKYADKKGSDDFRKALRTAQVLLWASSPVAAPAHLRADVVKARAKHGIPATLLQSKFVAPKAGPATNAFKNNLFALNREIARLIATLEQHLEELQAMSEQRNKECPRLQAHYDLLTACLMCRVVYLNEHAIALGDMRKDFPERDPSKHKGWQMEANDTIRDVPSKKQVRAGKRLLLELRKEHQGTAWEQLAEKAAEVPLSVVWKPWG
jgi:hypothetical protein